MYFEEAKKQTGNYAENALCYRCYKFTEQLMYAKQNQWNTQTVVFFNLLMLMVTKEHTYLKKPKALVEGLFLNMHDVLLPAGVKGLIGVLEIFKG